MKRLNVTLFISPINPSQAYRKFKIFFFEVCEHYSNGQKTSKDFKKSVTQVSSFASKMVVPDDTVRQYNLRSCILCARSADQPGVISSLLLGIKFQNLEVWVPVLSVLTLIIRLIIVTLSLRETVSIVVEPIATLFVLKLGKRAELVNWKVIKLLERVKVK